MLARPPAQARICGRARVGIHHSGCGCALVGCGHGRAGSTMRGGAMVVSGEVMVTEGYDRYGVNSLTWQQLTGLDREGFLSEFSRHTPPIFRECPDSTFHVSLLRYHPIADGPRRGEAHRGHGAHQCRTVSGPPWDEGLRCATCTQGWGGGHPEADAQWLRDKGGGAPPLLVMATALLILLAWGRPRGPLSRALGWATVELSGDHGTPNRSHGVATHPLPARQS
jgi:hypothetical protein